MWKGVRKMFELFHISVVRNTILLVCTEYLSLVRIVVKWDPLLARVLWLCPLLPPLQCAITAVVTSVSDPGSL